MLIKRKHFFEKVILNKYILKKVFIKSKSIFLIAKLGKISLKI